MLSTAICVGVVSLLVLPVTVIAFLVNCLMSRYLAVYRCHPRATFVGRILCTVYLLLRLALIMSCAYIVAKLPEGR